MRSFCAGAIILALLTAATAEQRRQGMRFWNLTLYALTSLQFSPPGKDEWGRNQCENDADGTVDHDERLQIVGLPPGRYDAKLTDRTGRTCIVRGIELHDGVFAIEERQLANCVQRAP
jgi:hypothetical protein